ncbi:MAG TPA: flagellar hook-associated protein FlgL [Methylomirabilota bacterium]|nr:flagellar hook-associated protein FlgL [Methylomirabilota bacterium]
MSIRINPDLLPDLLVSIQQSQQNEAIATQQLASGRSVNQLSDNPAAAAALVSNHDQQAQDDQFLQNNSSLMTRLQSADSTLSNVVQVLTRAVSIGTEGANSTVSAADQQAMAQEVQGLQSQLVGMANSTYQGTYLFSGTAITTQPFTLDPVTNAVTYNGNAGVSSTQLTDGNFVKTNVPGSQLFQSASGDAFGALQNLYTSLMSGNQANIGAAVTQAQNALSQVSIQRVFYGNAMNQVNLAESFLNQDKISLSSQENTLAGADLAETATNLAQAQLANQATLSATGRILSLPTLLDFIK